VKLKAKFRLPSLIALRTFEVAARNISFSAAANELFVTPGAVSRQIRLLEDEIGVQLFERSGNKVEINHYGKQLAKELSEAFRQISASVIEVQIKSAGEIRISSAPSIASKVLTNWLNDYSAIHSDISISLEVTDRIVDLEQYDADLAIRFLPHDSIPNSSRLLVNEVLIPVCTPDYLQSFGPWVEPDDLQSASLLHAEWGARGHEPVPGWGQWFSRFVSTKYDVPTGLQLHLLGLAVHEALNHRGIALGPISLVNHDLKNGVLVAPFGQSYRLEIPWGYYVVWPEKSTLEPTHAELVEWICACADKSFVDR
jgi:LysR family glycine cleavage system transcriptional activator